MIANGRTMRESIEAGTAFELKIPGWAGGYWPPAAESPDEVAECYRDGVRRGWFADLTGVEVRSVRIVGGSIGCFCVEDAGTVVL